MKAIKALKNSSLLSGSAVYLLSNVLNAAVPFTLLPILTRYLSPSEYGEIAMFQTLLAALAAFVGLSAVGAAGRKFFDHVTHAEFKAYVGSCFQILVASSLIVFSVIFLLGNRIADWVSLKETWVLLSVAVAIFGFVVQMRLGIWQIKKEAVQYGVLQVSHSVVNMLLSLLLVIGLALGAAGRIDAQIYATGGFAVISVFLLYRDDLLSIKWRPDQLMDILRFGVPLIPHIAGIFLLSSIDRFVINSKLGLAEAGIYMVAVQLTSAMGIVFDAVNKAYVPWLFERLARDLADEKLQIVRGTYAYFVAALLLVLLAFVIGPPLTVLIAGERYAEAGKVIGWLALGQAFGGMYLMVTNYTFYAKKTGMLSLSTIVSGVINVALLLAFVGQFGLTGAGIAFALSMAIRFFLTWLVAQKCHPMPWFYFLKPN